MSKRNSPRSDPRRRNPIVKFQRNSGMTNREVADALGYRSIDGVVRLKRYANGPSLIVAKKLADLIGWTTQDILEDFARRLSARRDAA